MARLCLVGRTLWTRVGSRSLWAAELFLLGVRGAHSQSLIWSGIIQLITIEYNPLS